MFSKLKQSLITICVSGLCLILIAIVVVSFLREEQFKKIYEDVIIPYEQVYAEKWLKAIENNDIKAAIKAANNIVIKQFPYIPKAKYLDITQLANINSNFFNPPYAVIDFEYWRDMYKMRKIVNSLKHTSSKKSIPEKIFNFINKKIKIIDYKNENDRPPFFYEILNSRKGDIIDKYLLFSILTEQAGYNTQIALVYSSLKKQPMHIVAETVKNSKHYTFDFFTDSFWKKSLDKVLSENKKQLSRLWKNKWTNKSKMIMYKAIHPPSSYKKANQYLGEYLNNYKNESMPIVGRDPENSQLNFKKQIANKVNNAYSLGIEPFLMVQNTRLFLKEWKEKKLPKKK